MIKIQLNEEKKNKIEKLFLEDLVGDTSGSPQRGKLIKALDQKESRDLLQNEHPLLYDYLYSADGETNVKNVKVLLLADRKQMEAFIKQFGTYTSTKANSLLDTVFLYTNFSNRKVVNEILREMDIPVCPYCNRLYITVLKKKKVRPQLDHFFPKARYPYLSLCLYNLIPSCGVCNQAKSDLNTMCEPLLYPYDEEFGEEVTFTLDLMDRDDFVRKMRGDSSEIRVRINNPSSKLHEEINRQDTRLHLTELYNNHGDYVADILKSYHINTEDRVAELFHCFPDIFSSRDEVRGLMFMSDIVKDRWSRRPLAKLTHDILRELDSLAP